MSTQINSSIENKKVGLKDLLSYKSYMLVMTSSLISIFGDVLDSLAYAYMVYRLTGSKILLGTLLAVNFIPNLLFTPFTGVIADNYSKKRMIVISDIARGIIVVFTATMYYFNLLRPWHLFVTTFMISTFESFSSPARGSLMPQLLPQELFMSARSFHQSLSSIVQLIAVSAVAICIATIGVAGTIAIDAITFFISAILILFIKYHEKNKGKKIDLNINNYISEIREGVSFVLKSKIILTILMVFALLNFSLMPFSVLRVPYVEETLGMGAEGLSYTAAAFLIGSIIGGLLVAQLGNKFKKSTISISGVILLGFSYAAFGLPSFVDITKINSVVYVFAVGIPLGISLPILSSPVSALLMQKTPSNLMGRVSAVASMVSLCASPLSASISGIVANYIPIPTYFFAMGALITLSSLILILSKDFRKE